MRMSNTAIVITRPSQQAGQFADKLQQIGLRSEFFPLIEIAELSDYAELTNALTALQTHALAVFVSPNAIDAVCSRMTVWPGNVSIGIMGEGSRAALLKHGISNSVAPIFSPVNPDKTDSETLLAALDLNSLRKQSVIIFKGESGRDLLSESLSAYGVNVINVTCYRRMAPEFSIDVQQRLHTLLAKNCSWIVTSSEALRTLSTWMRMIEPVAWVGKMQQLKLYVSHARIAETAHNLGFHSVTLTASGDENLLGALQSGL